MIDETRKILHAPALRVTATAARVPVPNCHCESVNVEFERPCTLQEVRSALENGAGVKVLDDPDTATYPLPGETSGKDDVYVGRIRLDESVESGVNLWIVADNILKGAALNAVQILELITREA